MFRNGSIASRGIRALFPAFVIGLGGLVLPAFAQTSFQSVPVVTAEEETPENGYIALRAIPVILEIPLDAEFIFLSGYEARGEREGENGIRVVLDRPGKIVVLVLATYDPVVWDVATTPGTNLAHVVVGGYHDSALKSDQPLLAYRADLTHAYETQNRRFREALETLQDIYGIDQIDYHFGQYRLPATITVAEIGEPGPRLALARPPATDVPGDFRFNLTRPDFTPMPWSTTGPVDGFDVEILAPEAVALSPDGRTAYQMGDDAIRIIHILSGSTREVPLPANFERFSFLEGIAYDTENDLVGIATSDGGGGAFYRFDAVAERWRDFRGLSQRQGLHSLAFDPDAGVYLATGQRRPNLIILSTEGDYLEVIDLGDALPGLYQTYDRNNRGVPSLSIVPNGRRMAIILATEPAHFAYPERPRSVRFIWLYDKDTRSGQLTYQQD